MAIAAEPSLPSGPLSAVDWAAISVTAVLETSVTASAVVASSAIAFTIANDNDHTHNGHEVDDCLHDGHDNVLVNYGLTLSCSLLVIRLIDHGNQCQCPSPGSMTIMTDNRMDDVEEEERGVPSSTGVEVFTMMGGNGDNVWGYKGDVAMVQTVISPTAKSLLCAYFASVNWPLKKDLPKGGEFMPSSLGVIMRDHNLVKTQVSRQLLNYKKEVFEFQQLAIILSASSILELEQMIRDGMSMTMPEFVMQTFVRLCSPGDPMYGTDFNNLADALKPFPPSAGIFVCKLVNGPVNDFFHLFVGVVGD